MVRQTQPSAAISLARLRYCSCVPPQPWTKRTPGMTVAGFTKVPEILSSPTGISICSSRVVMKPRDRIFGKGADFGVVSVEIHRSVGGRFVVRSVNFEACGVDRLH